ncbi:hypothetical protein ABZZ80_45580, partial [Streptomyces sp. NPDC006356]
APLKHALGVVGVRTRAWLRIAAATSHAALFGCLAAIVVDAMAGMITQVHSPRRHHTGEVHA